MRSCVCDYLAFDIETAVDEHAAKDVPPPEVAVGNIRDPAKIRDKQDEARRKQRDRLALEPHFARVIAIGLAWHTINEVVETGRKELTDEISTRAHLLFMEPDALDMGPSEQNNHEFMLLSHFWTRVQNFPGILTFNGAGFDLPFLMRRSLLLGVDPVRFEINKYRVIERQCNHIDIMQLLHAWEPGFGGSSPAGIARTLDFYAKALMGLDPPPYVDKANLLDLVRDDRVNALEHQVKEDAFRTLRLADMLLPTYCG